MCAFLCKDESKPVLQENIESAYVEVRDPKSGTVVCKAKSFMCVVCKAESFLCVVCKAESYLWVVCKAEVTYALLLART